MQVPVRLYRQHDMDLLRMYMNKSCRFTTEMRNALVAYANNKPYDIHIVDSPTDYHGYLKTSIMVHVSIDEKKYPEVIELFGKLKKGQRCAFIKTITRSCMTELPLSMYFDGDGIIMNKKVAEELEQSGEIVEGNNQLVNKLKKEKPVKVKENAQAQQQPVQPAKPAYSTTPVSDFGQQQPQQNDYTVNDEPPHQANSGNYMKPLNPLSTPTQSHNQDLVARQDTSDSYEPKDTVPYVEDLMQDFRPDVEDDVLPSVALFNKLAH